MLLLVLCTLTIIGTITLAVKFDWPAFTSAGIATGLVFIFILISVISQKEQAKWEMKEVEATDYSEYEYIEPEKKPEQIAPSPVHKSVQKSTKVVIKHDDDWYWSLASNILDQCKIRKGNSDCDVFIDEPKFTRLIQEKIPSHFEVVVSKQKECKGWFLNVTDTRKEKK